MAPAFEQAYRGETVVQVKCPVCEKRCAWEGNRWRPFCSERCRMIDLGCWIDEDYRIAGEPVLDEELEEKKKLL
ncbi:MAG: DNA gyrase inhibitor YacG [Desulfuromonadaceae bacterium]|nr:DNA gyrase inhibitor YacG [Desulfuromonadaceae bacterium]